MKIRKLTFILVLAIIALVMVGCGPAEPEPTPTLAVHPGKALVDSRCSICHGVAQVNNANYSADIWGATIDRMVQNGAAVNDEQKALLIDYLVTK